MVRMLLLALLAFRMPAYSQEFVEKQRFKGIPSQDKYGVLHSADYRFTKPR